MFSIFTIIIIIIIIKVYFYKCPPVTTVLFSVVSLKFALQVDMNLVMPNDYIAKS